MMGNTARTTDQTESDIARHLRNVLVRLSQDHIQFLQHAQSRKQSYSALLPKLVQEISEIILPRKIALVSDDQVVATLVAANRRLLSFYTNASAPIAEMTPEASAEAVAAVYLDAITDIEENSGPIVLRHLGRAPNPSTGNAACSAMFLAEVGLHSRSSDPLQLFWERVQPLALGTIASFDQQDVSRTGEPTATELLQNLEGLHLKQREEHKKRHPLERSGPSCSAFEIAPGIQGLLAANQASYLLAAVPEACVQDAFNIWREILT